MKKSAKHECEFMIKGNVKLCIHCGKIKEILPSMCEIIGQCKWITINEVTFCSQCGRLKEAKKY